MHLIFDKLTKKIREYEKIIITSHKNPDLDGLTSSIVLASIARKFNKEAFVYLNEENISTTKVKELVGTSYFVDKYNVDKNTLLIIVDTSSELYISSEKMLEDFQHIVVIDHHEISENNIENVEMRYINNNLSSIIEFMTYYLKYLNFKIEENLATLMLAGLEIDTNSFNMKTTSETYKAASILMEMGASAILKQDLLRNSREEILKRYELIKKSYVYKDIISICPLTGLHNPVELAQIADELLSFKNIEITFCLGLINKDEVRISIRTRGKYNAKAIASKLNGGGSLTSSAAVLTISVKECEEKIKEIVRDIL
ncbi:MAG: DHH family phosphoesterase [Erysipelotrichaceae bacterium]|nr:DHH family phosphoesterase [Erysipelotrichaceae bacterium]